MPRCRCTLILTFHFSAEPFDTVWRGEGGWGGEAGHDLFCTCGLHIGDDPQRNLRLKPAIPFEPNCSEPVFVDLLRSPGIDFHPGGPVRQPYLSYWLTRAGIFKKSMGARHRGGIGFSNRPARLHRLAEFIPWNQFRGPINI